MDRPGVARWSDVVVRVDDSGVAARERAAVRVGAAFFAATGFVVAAFWAAVLVDAVFFNAAAFLPVLTAVVAPVDFLAVVVARGVAAAAFPRRALTASKTTRLPSKPGT